MFFSYDILMYNPDIAERKRHLKVVLAILTDHQLYVNQKKCIVRHHRIQYLGCWISSLGVEADGEKIQVMVDWPLYWF